MVANAGSGLQPMPPAAHTLKELVTSTGTLKLKKILYSKTKTLEFCVYFDTGGAVQKTWLRSQSASGRLNELLAGIPELCADDISEDFKSGFAPGQSRAMDDNSPIPVQNALHLIRYIALTLISHRLSRMRRPTCA